MQNRSFLLHSITHSRGNTRWMRVCSGVDARSSFPRVPCSASLRHPFQPGAQEEEGKGRKSTVWWVISWGFSLQTPNWHDSTLKEIYRIADFDVQSIPSAETPASLFFSFAA
jgi:hypothetical protein